MKLTNDRALIITMTLFLVFVFMPLAGYAEIPKTMNYQGYLKNTDGPVCAEVQMTFAIYDAAIGGNLLWDETLDNVTVQEGIFSVILGNTEPIDLPFDEQYYMGVTVGDMDGEMDPIQQLTGVAYALKPPGLLAGEDKQFIHYVYRKKRGHYYKSIGMAV